MMIFWIHRRQGPSAARIPRSALILGGAAGEAVVTPESLRHSRREVS
jgi:hypothetical protein